MYESVYGRVRGLEVVRAEGCCGCMSTKVHKRLGRRVCRIVGAPVKVRAGVGMDTWTHSRQGVRGRWMYARNLHIRARGCARDVHVRTRDVHVRECARGCTREVYVRARAVDVRARDVDVRARDEHVCAGDVDVRARVRGSAQGT